MILAEYKGSRIHASVGSIGFCPDCGDELLARCGRIVTPHWAHRVDSSCPLAAGETDWHLAWKGEADPACVEVAVRKGDKLRRADILTPDGLAVEIQHSSISPDEIEGREAFWRRLVWVFDARDAAKARRLWLRERDGYHTFIWSQPRKTLSAANRPVLLDCGDLGILSVRKLYLDDHCAGWGYLRPREALAGWIRNITAAQQTAGAQ